MIELARKLIPLSQNGIFLDDMSNLVEKMHGNRFNHSLAWLRHPTKRQPIPIFELITLNWKAECFARLFGRWNAELEKFGIVTIKSISIDWYTGYWKVQFKIFIFNFCTNSVHTTQFTLIVLIVFVTLGNQ